MFLNNLSKSCFNTNKKTDYFLLDNFDLFFAEFNNLVKKNNITLISKYLKFLVNGIQSRLNMFCYYYRSKYENYRLFNSFLPYNLLSDFYNVNKHFNIKDTPIISSIWKMDRVFDNIVGIGSDVGNEFKFDDINVNNNIEATVIKELGLVFVVGSNHSINSAIVKNEGNLHIHSEISMKRFFDLYKFDGEKYVFLKNNQCINSNWCIEKCKPMLSELGYLFEISRVLNNYNIVL